MKKLRTSRTLLGLLILMTLGLGCASSHKRISDYRFVLEPRPDKIPAMIDGSPKPCPECQAIDGQRMWKFTERDFRKDKEKHLEKDGYIDYLLELLGHPEK